MATTQQIIEKILNGEYPISDFQNDCIENGEIENILFDLSLEIITRWYDNRRKTLLDMSIDYIRELFPLQYWQYKQLGRGPYKYKMEKGRFSRGDDGLKVLESPPERCLIVTEFDEEKLKAIFDKLVEKKYIDTGIDKGCAMEGFLNMFRGNASQGQVTWIKPGSKNDKEINKASFLMFLDLFKIPMTEWKRFAHQFANMIYSDKVEAKALRREGEVYNELKSIIG